MKELDKFLSDLFAKLPNLPEGVRAFIVKALPYLNILGIVFTAPVILVALNISGPLTFMVRNGHPYGSYVIPVLFAAAIVVLHILAIGGLFRREAKAWQYLYWAALLSGLEQIIFFNIAGLLIGTGLTLYILFQVRSSYH